MLITYLKEHLPNRDELFAALGVVVFFVHSWVIRGFLHEATSFIYYFRFGQIITIFLYMMGIALLESISVIFGLVVISVLFPISWFRKGFVYKSFVTVVVWAISMVQLESLIMDSHNRFPPVLELFTWAALAGGIWFILLIIFHLLKQLQGVALQLTDRIGVMAYFYIPLGVIGIIVMIFRNLY